MSREMSSDAVLMKNASNTNQSQRKTILGLGVACVDIIACVDTYPEPDEKIRAESVQLFSGGNVGNTLTAISRLGAANAKVLTKVGSDPNGELILSDFRNAMVDVEDVIISPTAATLLVYVIVDKQARRTCIASPNEEELTQSEILSKLSISSQISVSTESSALFDNVQLVHFDSRHTEAAIVLAAEANRQNILVSIDVEKNRTFLKDLLPLCDIFFTNKEFPELYFKDHVIADFHGAIEGLHEEYFLHDVEEFGSDSFNNALMAMSFFFSSDCAESGATINHSRAHLVVTTRGALGSLLMRRKDSQHLGNAHRTAAETVKFPSVIEGDLDSLSDVLSEELIKKAPIKISKFNFSRFSTYGGPDEIFEVIRCAAWPVDPVDIVDTTGAGDAFIGGFITGWSQGWSDDICMKLGTSVAAAKLSKIGAREGLPTPAEVNKRLATLIGIAL